jgi:4-aminobutyrate aminotransferase
MMAREHIMTWPRGAHGNTYGGNPIACAAALVTIDLIEKEYLRNTNEVGAYTKQLLEEIKYRHPSIGDVRGMGLMLGVEFIQDPETIEPAESLRDGVINKAFERGLLLLGCGKSTIRIAPPLSVTKDEVEAALMIFEEAITIAEQESSFLYVA